MWNREYDTSEVIYEIETDSQTQRKGGEGWIESLEVVDANDNIQEWINNRSYCIAQGTIQYPVINHNGKGNEKLYIYVYN